MNLIATVAFSLILLCAILSSQSQSPGSDPQQTSRSAQANDAEFTAARRLMEQGKYDDALIELQQLQVKSPGLKGLSRELGTLYYKKGDYLKAIASLTQALKEDPDDKEAIQL